MIWTLIILILGPPPPQGVVMIFDTERECRTAMEMFCTDATRYRCACRGVTAGPI